MSETPLHIRVAEALGWTHIGPGNSMNLGDPGVGYPPSTPIVGHKEPIPRFDTDWAATGPLVERFRLAVFPTSADVLTRTSFGPWTASSMELASCESGAQPSIAVCKLILALHAAGRLEVA